MKKKIVQFELDEEIPKNAKFIEVKEVFSYYKQSVSEGFFFTTYKKIPVFKNVYIYEVDIDQQDNIKF
jgi:hypothetical protein